jgi:hypothetical protein
MVLVKGRTFNKAIELTLNIKDMECWKNVLDAFSKATNTIVTKLFDAASDADNLVALTNTDQIKADGKYAVESKEPPRKKTKHEEPSEKKECINWS